jgi:hypothetical protein
MLPVILAALALAPATLGANTFLTAEFREIVTDAHVAVRGRVTDVRAVRSRAGDVESIVTIAVDTVLKGEATAFVSMRVPGGVIGRYRTVMTGAPVMKVGEHAVFFLKRAPDNTLWPVGLSQGVYRLTAAAPREVPTVRAPVVAGMTTNALGAVVRGDVRRKSMPLPEFESLVRLVVAARAK